MSQLLQDLQNPLQYCIRFQSSVPSLCGGVRVQSLPYKEGVELWILTWCYKDSASLVLTVKSALVTTNVSFSTTLYKSDCSWCQFLWESYAAMTVKARNGDAQKCKTLPSKLMWVLAQSLSVQVRAQWQSQWCSQWTFPECWSVQLAIYTKSLLPYQECNVYKPHSDRGRVATLYNCIMDLDPIHYGWQQCSQNLCVPTLSIQAFFTWTILNSWPGV